MHRHAWVRRLLRRLWAADAGVMVTLLGLLVGGTLGLIAELTFGGLFKEDDSWRYVNSYPMASREMCPASGTSKGRLIEGDCLSTEKAPPGRSPSEAAF